MTTLRHKDLLGLIELSRDEIEELLALAHAQKIGRDRERHLEGKTIGMLFTVASTRTRISFQVAARRLGAHAEFFTPSELQLSNHETLADTAAVMSRYLDAVVVRTYDMNSYGQGREALRTMARHCSVPIINALDDREHPCQVLADVMTLREKLGEGLRRKKIVFTWAYAKRQKSPGVTHSMIAAASILGLNLTLALPRGFEPEAEYLDFAERECRRSGGRVEMCDNLEEAARGADVIYAKSWKSLTSSTAEDLALRERAKDEWRVSEEHFALANAGALFMDCMPSIRGDEATSEVVDGPRSIRLDEAENRLHVQKAVLASLL